MVRDYVRLSSGYTSTTKGPTSKLRSSPLLGCPAWLPGWTKPLSRRGPCPGGATTVRELFP